MVLRKFEDSKSWNVPMEKTLEVTQECPRVCPLVWANSITFRSSNFKLSLLNPFCSYDQQPSKAVTLVKQQSLRHLIANRP